jgi:ribonuclease D
LSEKQLAYALSDVTHLRTVYDRILADLKRTGRASWVEGELENLADLGLYTVEPEDAWKRLKARTNKPRFLAVLRELAAWREREAQRRDLPRNRVIRDEALLEIASDPPESRDKLAGIRSLNRKIADGPFGAGLMEAVQTALAQPKESWPRVERPEPPAPALLPVIELLKVLLKRKCAAHGVAQKLVCPGPDIEKLAADDEADILALKGWRREVFGNDALRLKAGSLGLAIQGQEVVEIPLDAPR